MAFILLLFARIASVPRAVATIPQSAIAMITAPSVQSAIETASRRNSRVFVAYIMALIVTGLIIAFFTWLTWDSGNKVQDAVQAEANARIGEAKQKAAEANDTAGKANERAAVLELGNLTLRGQVATLEASASTAQKDVARLQKDASDAKAEQQRVQTQLASQQERAAKAEKDLAQLKLAVQPRRLTADQQVALVSLLSGDPKGAVSITCVMGDGEGNAFATDVDSVLKKAGWASGGVDQSTYSGGDPTGFGMLVHSALTAPPYASRLQQAFFAVGVPLAGVEDARVAEGTAHIVVGHKPPIPQ